MKSILMSIKPQWVAKILNGEKTIEIRKKFPKDYVGWVYIYMCQDHKRDWYYCKELGCYSKDIHDHNVSFEAFKDLRPLNAKVIARFWCDKVEPTNNFYEEEICSLACISKQEYFDYLGYDDGYAIHITKLEIFDKPKEISEFSVRYPKGDIKFEGVKGKMLAMKPLTRAPESYCYVEV